jgi:hypothetical protein
MQRSITVDRLGAGIPGENYPRSACLSFQGLGARALRRSERQRLILKRSRSQLATKNLIISSPGQDWENTPPSKVISEKMLLIKFSILAMDSKFWLQRRSNSPHSSAIRAMQQSACLLPWPSSGTYPLTIPDKPQWPDTIAAGSNSLGF